MRIPDSVTRSIGRSMLRVKKNSPHMFFAAGLVGLVGAGVLACRATLKLEKELDAIKTDIDSAKETKELVKMPESTYTESDYAKELSKVYVKSTIKVVKLYAPSIAVGTVSVVALTGSHIQLTRRNAALTATLGLVTQAFEDYRARVRTEVGEEREAQLYGCLADNVIEAEAKEITVRSDEDAVKNPYGLSPYARLFDENSRNWQKQVDANIYFLEQQQRYANHRLKTVGHVFLNEVYDMLDMPRSKPGSIMGWMWRSNGEGDEFVNFGINNVHRSPWEPRIWLDFNVDGIIFDKI